jgi:poly-beta-hydroxyalkanoate depolymerase
MSLAARVARCPPSCPVEQGINLLTEAEDRLVPSPVLVEGDYWLVKLGGANVWKQFCR